MKKNSLKDYDKHCYRRSATKNEEIQEGIIGIWRIWRQKAVWRSTDVKKWSGTKGSSTKGLKTILNDYRRGGSPNLVISCLI